MPRARSAGRGRTGVAHDKAELDVLRTATGQQIATGQQGPRHRPPASVRHRCTDFVLTRKILAIRTRHSCRPMAMPGRYCLSSPGRKRRFLMPVSDTSADFQVGSECHLAEPHSGLEHMPYCHSERLSFLFTARLCSRAALHLHWTCTAPALNVHSKCIGKGPDLRWT
jgi:hypothetical protein